MSPIRPPGLTAVLDLTMPRTSGGAVVEQTCRLDKDVPVILSSGFDKAEVSQRFSGWQRLAFLVFARHTARHAGPRALAVAPRFGGLAHIDLEEWQKSYSGTAPE